jgi:cell surface protein SprA
MAQLPNVASETSITRMEVWVTNRVNSTEAEAIVCALIDLGYLEQPEKLLKTGENS